MHVFAKDTLKIVNMSRKKSFLKENRPVNKTIYNITTLDFAKVTANVNIGTVYVQDSSLQWVAVGLWWSSSLKFFPLYRGRILGRNWDKSLQSFPPCYSQLPLLTDLSKSGLKLVCNVNIVYGNLKSEKSQDYAQKPQRNLRSWIRLLYCPSPIRSAAESSIQKIEKVRSQQKYLGQNWILVLLFFSLHSTFCTQDLICLVLPISYWYLSYFKNGTS